MRVLVTGATGFVGAHVLHALLASGHAPRALARPGRPRRHVERAGVEIAEGDLSDERSLVAACRGVEGLVHCAARTGFWSRQNDLQRKVNVEGTSALYRAAHKMKVARIVHVSSVAAVGATRHPALLDESAVWNLRRLRVNYATTKRAGEERALAAAWGGMPIVVVNPSFVLGPRLDGGPPSSLVARIAAGELRFVPAGGVSVTDVRDVTQGILAALERGRAGERYVLAGHNLTWRQLYDAIAELSGVRAPRLGISPGAARVMATATGVLDALRLSRPSLAPELWRAQGWYSWYDSARARRELGYQVRPLEEILRGALEAVPTPTASRT